MDVALGEGDHHPGIAEQSVDPEAQPALGAEAVEGWRSTW